MCRQGFAAAAHHSLRPPVFSRGCWGRSLVDENRASGQVLLLLLLKPDRAGSLRSAEGLKPRGNGFDEAALQAVKNAQFLPAVHHGVQVPCRALLPISFRLWSGP
ncbi:TonB family protein [Trichloromonas sp.]|uniref:TonB family protein n=1 Tax=Trichloromonas sp. TaxID=3069249 RepID=UPI003D81C02A